MGLGRWGGRGSEYAGVRDMPFPALDFGLDAREYKRGKDGRFASSGSAGSKTAKKAAGKGEKSKKAAEAKSSAKPPKTKAKEPPAGIQFTTPVRGGRGGGTPATGQFKANSTIRERKPGEEVHWRRDENDPYCPTCGKKTGPDRPWTEKRRPEHTFTSEWAKNEAKDSCPHCGGPLTVATSNDRPAMGRHGGRSSDKAGSRDRYIPKAA